MAIELKNIKSVKISDYSEYQSETSRNGGDYGYWTTYTRVGNGWEVNYGTTSDLQFCPCCGSFGCSCSCNGEFEAISEGELEDIIQTFIDEHEGDPDYEIGFEKADD